MGRATMKRKGRKPPTASTAILDDLLESGDNGPDVASTAVESLPVASTASILPFRVNPALAAQASESTAAVKNFAVLPVPSSKPSSAVSLFGEDDDMFAIKPTQPSVPKSSISKPALSTGSSLLSDDSDDMFAPKSKPIPVTVPIIDTVFIPALPSEKLAAVVPVNAVPKKSGTCFMHFKYFFCENYIHLLMGTLN